MLYTNDTMAAETYFDAPTDSRSGARFAAQVCYKKS